VHPGHQISIAYVVGTIDGILETGREVEIEVESAKFPAFGDGDVVSNRGYEVIAETSSRIFLSSDMDALRLPCGHPVPP
jgi:hypothetical protein